MTHNKYISMIAVAAGLGWLGWLLVVNRLSPYESVGLSLLFFYLTLFLALSCTLTILGFYFRVWLFKNEVFYKHINVSLRQGIFLALIAIFSLVFQMVKVLTWWSGILLILIAMLLEFYFSSKDSELN